MSQRPDRIYKIADPADWGAALLSGTYTGSEHDRRDGFIHFSTADQTPGTLFKHFAEATRLVFVAIDAGALGAALKWEKSRGGEDFPHLYGDLPLSAVIEAHLLSRGTDGEWTLPEDFLR